MTSRASRGRPLEAALFAVHVAGSFNTTRAAWPHLVDQGYGTAKAAANGLIDRLQLPLHQRAYALKRLAAAVIATQLFVSPTECAV